MRVMEGIPQEWHMETQLEDQAVEKARRGPTSTITSLVRILSSFSRLSSGNALSEESEGRIKRKEAKPVFSGSKVSPKSHNNF